MQHGKCTRRLIGLTIAGIVLATAPTAAQRRGGRNRDEWQRPEQVFHALFGGETSGETYAGTVAQLPSLGEARRQRRAHLGQVDQRVNGMDFGGIPRQEGRMFGVIRCADDDGVRCSGGQRVEWAQTCLDHAVESPARQVQVALIGEYYAVSA